MARFAVQNDSFCRAEWAFFACKMSHFESPKNVKKTQVVCFQRLITFSYFACTRPSDFYFGKTAVISYNKCYFVNIIQHSSQRQRQGRKPLSYASFLSWIGRCYGCSVWEKRLRNRMPWTVFCRQGCFVGRVWGLCGGVAGAFLLFCQSFRVSSTDRNVKSENLSPFCLVLSAFWHIFAHAIKNSIIFHSS